MLHSHDLPMLHSHDNVLTSIIEMDGKMKRIEGICVAAVYHKLKFWCMAGVILYACINCHNAIAY